MTKPYITLLREAVRDRLAGDDALKAIFGDRIFLNRSDAFAEAELPSMGVYLVSVTPVENDYHPRRDLRKAELSVEAFAAGADLEGGLDWIDALVKAALTIGPIEARIKTNGGPEKRAIDAITWVGSELGYLPEATKVIGAIVMSYEFEFLNPTEPPPLPEFIQANLTLNVDDA
jgi:hypothetical protein